MTARKPRPDRDATDKVRIQSLAIRTTWLLIVALAIGCNSQIPREELGDVILDPNDLPHAREPFPLPKLENAPAANGIPGEPLPESSATPPPTDPTPSPPSGGESSADAPTQPDSP